MESKKYLDQLTGMLKNTKISIIEPYETLDILKGLEVLAAFFLRNRDQEKKVFFIGNGGSAAIAIHMTADFMKNGGMKTCSMFDSATITCLGNDYGYEYIFSKQIERIAGDGDVLVAISSSGNSPNIVKALEVAKDKRMKKVTLSGFRPDNKICQAGDINVYVPCNEYGIVESIHNLILQQIVDMLFESDNH